MAAWTSLLTLLFLAPAGAPDEDPEVVLRRFLNVRRAVGPSLSPDGQQVVFRMDVTGVDQVWRLDGPEEWPEQLTFAEDAVGGVGWAPTGDALYFMRDAGGNEQSQIFRLAPDGTGLKNLTDDPETRHFFGDISPDGKWLTFSCNKRDRSSFDVWVMDIATGEAEIIYQGKGYNMPGPYSPDGKKILGSTWRSNFDSDIWVLDLETKEKTNLNPEGEVARFESTDWTADGKGILVVTDLRKDMMGIARVSLENPTFEFLEEPKWDVDAMVFTPDRTAMATIENEDGYSRLRLRKIDDGSDLPLPALPKGMIGGLDISENGRYLAFDLVSPVLTHDIWRIDLEKQERVRMTRSCLAGLDPKTFVGPELIHYPTFDGMKIPAFLYTPPGAKRDGTMPAIILVHGGPEGQERPYFSRFRQIFLRKGYAILAPNVRGSTGYGKAFTHLDDVEKRLDSVKDLAAGYDYLVEQKIADPKKIAVLGGSYGGYMVLAGLTSYPDKYAAGIDIVGIASFTTFLKNTASYRRAIREAEYGSLEDDAEFLEKISPLNHVDKIKAPLMVIHGKNDPRVPYTEAEQIVDALKARQQPVDYLLFEDEGHGVAKLDNRVVMYVRIVEFLDKYLMGVEE